MSVLKFLGATVLNYNSNVGYNNQESTLDMSLVEDPRDGDIFHLSNNLTREGHPTYFQHGAFFFGGIVRTWSKNSSTQGTTYSVSLTDPRVFFEGISLIINDYTNYVTTPNIINVYGYLEDTFGGSNKNDAGVQASLILSTLMNMSGSSYNGGISFYGINYYIDITGIPIPPAEFRLNQTVISFADFLNEIAEVTSSTYTSYLYLVNNKWTIGFAFSSRSVTPVRGAIGSYVSQLTNPSVKNNGIELVNEVTTKLLFGGNKTDIYIQNYKDGAGKQSFFDFPYFLRVSDVGQEGLYIHYDLNIDKKNDTNIDNPICGYYGKDLDGNLAITTSNFRNFDIDARNVKVTGLKDIYHSNDDELRAALSGQDTWIAYLACMWPYEYIPDQTGLEEDFYYISVKNTKEPKANKKSQINKKKTLTPKVETLYEIVKSTSRLKMYTHSGVKNPHFKKAIELKIGNVDDIWMQDINLLDSYMDKGNNNELFENPVDALFTLISNFANENYGKKFTVKVPEVNLAVEPDTNLRRYNMVPTEGGYLDESQFEGGVANSLVPQDVFALTLDDNRLSAYVRFDKGQELDLSVIGVENLIFGKKIFNNSIPGFDGKIFVKCEVDPEFVFTDYKNAIGARALITLPEKITRLDAKTDFFSFIKSRVLDNTRGLLKRELFSFIDSNSTSVVKNFVKTRYNLGDNSKVTFFLDSLGTPQTEPYEQMSVQTASVGSRMSDMAKALVQMEMSDKAEQSLSTLSVVGDFASYYRCPDMAAIPLLSNTSFYGPWISSIGTGKTEVEYNSELVPWNFNGFEVLNKVANAKVNEISGNLTWSETGSIEIPGIPICSLGQQLVSSGPYVSDISVSIGTDGFMTSYKMSSWTPRFSKISNTMTDKLARVTKTAQIESRAMIEKFRIKKRSK